MAYIGKKMSENAYQAHKDGLLVKSQVDSRLLKKYGFKYSVGFFRWLCDKKYIKPVAFHHTSASCKLTPFYSPKAISFMQNYCNLDILYKQYLNKTTREEIKKQLGIKYAKAYVSADVLGIKCDPIEFHCVKYKNLLFWSTETAFHHKSNKVKVIEVFDDRPSNNWNNKNTRKIINKIILYKNPDVKVMG
ncbi:hypothetical protein HZF24_01700 [Sedimentibacter hydroxybenzoicus DSM 7310]|uniref:Uncharacterized protein n=1 Tax=Sedimentibacter hydroxybenzoicus DSM 7310 TaxID=1123245 RepID=A0A974GV19_SEDHY|nr:hypothetical protein [Sedimentibacter hydroxybenzoicus]NYB72849.1 hypothetical protein [Sedimentibacter hydroxybenzoicus DSM 7310]